VFHVCAVIDVAFTNLLSKHLIILKNKVSIMVSKSKLFGIATITMLLFLMSFGLVVAQYSTETTTNVAIPYSGVFNASAPDLGVSYSILGTPGATGTVTAAVYNGNPNPTATVPAEVSLTYFIAITINMNESDFTQATISISYSNSDVQNIQTPYTIYKYVADSNSYTPLNSIVDTNTKTITVTLSSITDPLLAIGGNSKSAAGIPTSIWIAIIVAAIVIVLVAVFLVRRLRHSSETIVVHTRS